MNKNNTFIFALLSFIVGLGVDFFLPRFPIFIFVFLLLLLLFPLPFLWSKKKTRTILILFVALLGGIFRAQLAYHIPTSADIDFYNDQPEKISVEGIVSEDPDVRTDQIKLTLKLNKKSEGLEQDRKVIQGKKTTVEGKILITTSRYPEYQYGDKLKITGKLKTPVEFEKFSYKNYLQRYHIYSVIYNPKIEVLSQGHGNPLFASLFRLKKLFENSLNRVFPEPYASFEAGLLLGSRKGIPEDLTEKFNITGLTHIIAISGYNITIIVSLMMALLAGLGRRFSIIFSLVGILLFTIFVGASPAVVRAAIMGILALMALNYGRRGSVTIAILFTIFLMLAWNPLILYYDVGFQLSFLATLGLVYISPLFEKISQKIPETFGIKEGLILTISAQIAAVPIIIFNFERLSLVAPLANVLVTAFIPFAMLFGFFAGILGLIIFPIAKLAGFLAYLFLEYIIQVTTWTAKIPAASVDIQWFSRSLMIVYYLGLIVFLIRWWMRRKLAKA